MNLKLHLLLQITAVAVLCLLGTGAYVLSRANYQIRQESEKTAEMLAKLLEVQLMRIGADIESQNHFPDFDLWKQTYRGTAVCVHYSPVGKGNSYRICQGGKAVSRPWPIRFEAVYRRIFNPEHAALKPVDFNGRHYGVIAVTPEPEMELSQAWNNVASLLGLSSSTVAAVCLLVYISIYRALRPAQTIVSGLESMRQSDSTAVLPVFELIEWQLIGAAINQFSATQKRLLDERKHLIMKLMTLQEEERRYLARELHDEFGQCLAATNALAASIVQTARHGYPHIVPEAENIIRINGQIMEALRTLLVQLRPAELDELGLEFCLNTMVTEWNKQFKGQKHCQLHIEGDCSLLKEPLPVTLFRIVQEGLTNIAKHSSASQASILLEISRQNVVLTIEDNGNANSAAFTGKPGMGLIGINERVTGLDGRLSIQTCEPCGFGVRVELPIPF